MRSGLISIVVPVYNAEKYLERCLESLVSQIYSPLEIILVNDGSTDLSGAICDRYASKCEAGCKVTVIHQQNTGASIARKNGIAASKGEYITFVDADDVVSPLYVSALYDAIIKYGTNMSVCRYEIGESALNYQFAENPESRLMDEKELFQRFFKYEFWGFPGALYKKSLFEMVDFPEATVNEDYYVKAQLFCKEANVAEVTPALYYYEKHTGSLSNLKISERALGEFDNAYATWKFILHKDPKLSSFAIAIAAESGCKWLYAMRSQKDCNSDAVEGYRKKILDFISGNKIEIFIKSKLYWKVKLQLILLYCQDVCFSQRVPLF